MLAVAAAATQLLVWWLRPPPKPAVTYGPPRASYELDDFTVHAFGNDGKPAFSMTAPHLARREGDDSLYVNAPAFRFVASDGSPWNGNAQYAWISADNGMVKLIGTTTIHRPPSATVSAAEILTADATIWTDDKRMATDAPSVIRQPGSILRGTGMKANFDTRHLELLSDVHATLTPHAAAPPAAAAN